MAITEDLKNMANIDTEEIRERIEEAAEVMKREAPRVLVPAMAMSGACIAAILGASALERGSPWAGINAVTAGIGLTGKRPPAKFDALRTLAGLGTIFGGTLAVAILHSRVNGGRLARGLVASLGALALDRAVMRREIFPAFRKTLGVAGTILKYAAIGIAAAISPRSRMIAA
jgi:ElaB/YqjD/DUF883 family membrane-anchored ribosome-binding protein